MRWEELVGQKVRALRKAKGLSQEALAHEAGMAMRYLAGIERGEENPTLAFLVRIADALGVEPKELLER
ncbi:MAG: XRE family transcriptional regulator [Brevundimonas sp.]|uniref:helix-turn-helix domain-containing protein n=1 Tax=Brevundimonas sp. TaxID=1871086 RepID=UPI0012160392|nr:helix-turn-helix transcriptional regulator [Brevundimonas sp.]RZJ17653.1 MAG: XRE family transcriptional regulator [Brevundimonas sp.]